MNRESTTSHEPNDDDLGTILRSQKTPVPIDLDYRILTAAREAINTPAAVIQHTAKKPRVAQWFAVAATLVLGISVAPLLLKAPESSLESLTPQSTRTMPSPSVLDVRSESDNLEQASGSSAGDSFVRAASQPASLKTELTNISETKAKQKRTKLTAENSVVTTSSDVQSIPRTTAGDAQLSPRSASGSIQPIPITTPDNTQFIPSTTPGSVQLTPSTTPASGKLTPNTTPGTVQTTSGTAQVTGFDTNTLSLVPTANSVSSKTDEVPVKPDNARNGLTLQLQSTKSLKQSNIARKNKDSLKKPASTYYQDSPETWLFAIRLFVKRGYDEIARQEYDLFRKRYPLYEPDFKLNDSSR